VSLDPTAPDPGWTAKDTSTTGDPWSAWLLSRRQGGRDLQPDQRAELKRYRDGVLAGADLQPGDVLLDVGCGDGLIGFGAADALDHAVRLVFSDISAELLQRCAQRAAQMGMSDSCRFVQARAEDLADVSDLSVDVVTTRSVLIYVSRKRDAFAEFFRVLRPGGRLSIFEPINRRLFPEPANLFWGWDVSAVADLRDRVAAEFEGDSRPESQSMMNFDEDDLVALARDVGFDTVELVLHVADEPASRQDWESVVHSSPNPMAPTLLEAVTASLEAAEATRFLNALRASVEAGMGRYRTAGAYLRARKD
jgi:arsenite methyltransferase